VSTLSSLPQRLEGNAKHRKSFQGVLGMLTREGNHSLNIADGSQRQTQPPTVHTDACNHFMKRCLDGGAGVPHLQIASSAYFSVISHSDLLSAFQESDVISSRGCKSSPPWLLQVHGLLLCANLSHSGEIVRNCCNSLHQVANML
jgi:hypothetical protein